MARRNHFWDLAFAGLVFSAGCASTNDDAAPSAPVARVTVCEPGRSSTVQIAESEVPALTARGGFVAELRVDRALTRNSPPNYRRITDALAEARRIRKVVEGNAGSGCPITILVAAGAYEGTTAGLDTIKERLPLLIDMPNVTIRGRYQIPTDSAARPRGPAGTAGTILTANPQLAVVGGTTQTGISEPMILVNSENGVGGDGAVIEGFVLRSGHAASDTNTAGKGVLTFRAANVRVQGNSFEGNFTERVDLRGGSGAVVRNFSSGPGGTCDICVAGPGTFEVFANTLRDGGIPGILVVPATVLPAPAGVNQFFPPSVSFVSVDISRNEISGHQRTPVGVGIRLATIGIGAPNVAGTSRLTIRDNYVHHNRFGVIVEAGFPVAGSSLKGDAIIETSGNQFVAQCQTDLYVALTRHTAGLGLAAQPYSRSSAIQITLGGELPWDRAWLAHPDGLLNTVTVNGALVANGVRHAYDAAKRCP